jgi:hypothetical protein
LRAGALAEDRRGEHVRGLGLDRPCRHQQAARAGVEEGPAAARHGFRATPVRGRGVAGRQHDPVSVEAQRGDRLGVAACTVRRDRPAMGRDGRGNILSVGHARQVQDRIDSGVAEREFLGPGRHGNEHRGGEQRCADRAPAGAVRFAVMRPMSTCRLAIAGLADWRPSGRRQHPWLPRP